MSDAKVCLSAPSPPGSLLLDLLTTCFPLRASWLSLKSQLAVEEAAGHVLAPGGVVGDDEPAAVGGVGARGKDLDGDGGHGRHGGQLAHLCGHDGE